MSKSGKSKKTPIIDTLKPKKRLTKADKELIEITQAVMDTITKQKNAEVHRYEQSENFNLEQNFRDTIFDEVKVMKDIKDTIENSNNNGRESGKKKKIPIIDTLKPKKRLTKEDKEMIKAFEAVMDAIIRQQKTEKNAEV